MATLVGIMDGTTDGTMDGTTDGTMDGTTDGTTDGTSTSRLLPAGPELVLRWMAITKNTINVLHHCIYYAYFSSCNMSLHVLRVSNKLLNL